jgi:hypothetical protein
LNNEEKRQKIYQEYLSGEMQLNSPKEEGARELLKNGIPPLDHTSENLEMFMQKMVQITLARNVIAQEQGADNPGMQELVNDLDNKFLSAMRIVRVIKTQMQVKN